MSRFSWRLRVTCSTLAVVAGGSLVGASEVSAPAEASASVASGARPGTLFEPAHAEPSDEALERFASLAPRDVTGSRFPGGLTIRGGTRHRMIFFTFDDGPSRNTTPELLDTLDELGIKGLFFVTSQNFGNGNPWEREHADIVREIVRRGHLLGSHTDTHRQLPLLSEAEIEVELSRSRAKIEWAVGHVPRLIRPPGGALSKRVEDLLTDQGYTSVLWTVYPGDLEVETPDEVVRTFFRVLRRRERETGDRGGIVLLHDTKPHSLDAVPLLVDALARRNCALLERGEELYDVVDDLGYFIPGYLPDLPIEERQARLRRRTERECAAPADAN